MLLALIAVMLAVQVCGVSASANPLDSFAFVETSYTYENSSSTENNTIIYNDGMLLTDANALSADLAKVSVGLSMAAYSQSTINNVLTSMGFYCWDNSVVYSREDTLSIYDNDYAAYTVATKTIEYGGEEYIVYCVPVKGTSANSEWYSNFNLGAALGNRVHEGFEKPAKEILDKLETMFANDSYSKENRIIWLTGHSRAPRSCPTDLYRLDQCRLLRLPWLVRQR